MNKFSAMTGFLSSKGVLFSLSTIYSSFGLSYFNMSIDFQQLPCLFDNQHCQSYFYKTLSNGSKPFA